MLTKASLTAPPSTTSPAYVTELTVAVVVDVPPVIVSVEAVKSVETYLNVSVLVPAVHVTTSAVGVVEELPEIVSPTVKSPDAPDTTIVAVALDETIRLVITPPVLLPADHVPEISLIVNNTPVLLVATPTIVPSARVVF